MAGKSMQMNLILHGDTTEGFDALGSKMSALGAAMEQISGKAREFEENSVETYKNYETYMLEAKGALTAQYESQSQLARVMQGLDQHAQNWAATTIFDTQDVSKAISEAAHAGWDYEQMAEGIPSAMLLAQAGNTDLATGLNYLIKALNATGTEFENSDVLIDQWAMAANSGATNISELGEAILRMGSTAKFGDSTAELFTMLAVLADMGTVGADAGTLLRNSMIRLIAPTEKANKVMAELGVTEEEALEVAADDESLKKANELLEQTGFSAYDSNGELKPFLDTYKELYAAVSGMSEVDRNAVLSAIFPTRTITGALGLLEAASQNYDGLYEKILGSEGYAEKVADIQTSGLMGTFENIESKFEEFSRKTGKTLAPGLTLASDTLGGIMDTLNAMPEEDLSALVGGITGIAAAGPSLMIAGGALKLFTMLGPIGTSSLIAAAGLGAIVGYANKISEINFESAFGTLELDLDELGEYIDSVDTKFDLEQNAVSTWSDALATAQENYLNLSSTLAEDLLSASLTSRTLTEQEITDLESLGSQMITSLRTGIENAEARDLTFIDMLFGDMSDESETEAFTDSVNWIDARYAGLYAQAEAVGQQMREAMTSALLDGTLNEQERAAIQASVDRMNQIQAEIAATMAQEEYYAQLHKAQNVSWDSLDEYLTGNEEKQVQDLADMDELYHQMYGQLRAAWQNEYDNATTDAQRTALEAEWSNTETNFNREWQDARQGVSDKYGEFAFAAFDALMAGSDHQVAWNYMKAIQAAGGLQFDQNGFLPEGFNYGTYLPDGVSFDEMSRMVFAMHEDGDRLAEVLTPFSNNAGIQGLKNIFDAAYAVGDDLFTESIKIPVEPEVDTASVESAVGVEPIPVPVEPDAEIDSEGMAEDAAIAGTIAEAALMGGYGDPLLEAEVDEDGISEKASSAGNSAQSALYSAWGHPVLTARVTYSGVSIGSSITGGSKMYMYAEGGRATEASIFGEAGPEWAIPEEHSARTAELLNLARQASGFTWGDLISRYGGLNAMPNQQTVQLTYAPTIHASDASGVEQVLASDKERMARMVRALMEESKMRDDAEVYT